LVLKQIPFGLGKTQIILLGCPRLRLKLPEPFSPKTCKGWDQSTVTALFHRIWRLSRWDDLRPDLEDLRPEPSPSRDWDDNQKKESFANLVTKLQMIFADAADHPRDFYLSGGGAS
jgi:hypothetical protein